MTSKTLFPLFALVLLLTAGATTASADRADRRPPHETLLLQQPTVSATQVVFVYAEDLWIVGRKGGDARRLTSHVGRESSPRLSPDGRWVAFTGEYEGDGDVYVISVDGGLPRRLTWHPGRDTVQGWHPNGKRILFSSGRIGGAPVDRLFQVSIDGGMPEALEIPKVGHASWNGAGTRIAYTPIRDAFRTWKRYRGGRTPPVWIFDSDTHEVEVVPHVNASDTFPCWIGDDVYFASDRTGQMNVWRFTPGAKAPVQVTDFPRNGFGVRNMSSGAGVLAYTQAGAVHVFDPKDGTHERLSIRCKTDGLSRNPRWEAVRGSVRNGTVSPNGKRAAFEARGEIITVPRENGAARNISESPGANDRDPAWSPDGSQVAWFSDASGEYKLVIRDRLGREEPKTYDLGGARFYYDPSWSPDGKHLVFSDKGNRLAYVTLETGKVTEIATTQGSLGVWRPFGVWSPDSQWIAFEHKDPATTYGGVSLFCMATGEITPLTDGFADASSPAFSTDGKYLFFQASTESGPQSFGLDLSTSQSRAGSSRLYVVVLEKDGENPLAAESDDESPKKKEEKKDADEKKGEKKEPAEKKDGDDEKKDGDKKDDDEDGKDTNEKKADEKPKAKAPSIDVLGIDQRILALPHGSGRFHNLVCVKDRLLFLEFPQEGDPTLRSFDFKDRKAKDVMGNVSSVEVAHGGKHLLLEAGRSWKITNDAGKDAKTCAIDGVRVRVEPEVEWGQILRETWRIQRDFFYDPQLHQVDWDAMWERWSAFLPYVEHRADLTVLQAELMGELCCGHEYVFGGDMPNGPSAIPVGLLGCDFEADQGRFRIARIYKGQNWNARLRAPLTEPGVDANVGDYLIAVDGRGVTADQNLFAAFEGTANERVELTLSDAPEGGKERTTVVVPIPDDGALRRLAWVEDCRRRVDELSDGRLAYAYMPNTGGAGLASFNRDYFSQLDKEGLILDERYNGGGKVADYVVDVLGREVICYWMNREGWLGRTPFGTMEGPKVMIANEYAGSGGDAMPWMFKKLKIGKLVGTRTWGGLVGISGYPPLMDGGRCTSASFGIMDTDGKWVVENVGVAPDVEVIEWPKDVIAGHDPQLEKAVEIALKQLHAKPKADRPGYSPPAAR